MAKALDWIKAHYDRVALIAGAAFLLISTIGIGWSAIQFARSLAAPQASRAKTASPPPVAVELDRAAEQLEKPSQWKASTRSGLLVPEKHFIGPDGLPATLQNTQVHPPVPNDWFEKFALPIQDADVLDQDPDKDGFTNLDEWQGNTDPTNKESHPDYTTKLHLVSATEEPFRYIFASRIKNTFGINTIDQTEPTQFLKIGDLIRGTDFKIVDFAEKRARNEYGMNEDVSELLLEHQGGARVTLVKGKIATSPQSVATFVYAWGGRREFEVRKDQEFPIATAEGNRTYKLIEVQPAKAVIVNTEKPDARIEIGFAAP
ncbi:MAG TPA: Amuc_1099 family pilus-like system protein [Candidatus Udaeobacter sp.]|nr:Amuc_1099 family pilus-like system protein [Candidatus Udaeobacter sp.]